MIVAADTTPLNYLLIIGECDILPKLYDRVVVPSIVIAEMSRAQAPPVVRTWATSPPEWAEVAAPAASLRSPLRLDRGEADAIALAVERGITHILIDERRGSRIARTNGLLAVPTLAILERAAERSLVRLPEAIAKLRKTSIRVPEVLLRDALARDLARRQSS